MVRVAKILDIYQSSVLYDTVGRYTANFTGSLSYFLLYTTECCMLHKTPCARNEFFGQCLHMGYFSGLSHSVCCVAHRLNALDHSAVNMVLTGKWILYTQLYQGNNKRSHGNVFRTDKSSTDASLQNCLFNGKFKWWYVMYHHFRKKICR